MPTIFSRSSACQELIDLTSIEEIVTVPMFINTLTVCASGVNPNRVYQGQTRKPLVLVLRNGANSGLNSTDYNWYIDIKQIATSSLLVNRGPVVFSTDENDDPVFQYNWQYGDNDVVGKYEAQVYGELIVDGRQIVFEPYKYIVRPRI